MPLFHGLPGFDPDKVHYAENEVRRWVKNRKGINPRSPYLPGGRQLTWPELNELNLLLGEAYGFNALIDKLGLPLRHDADLGRDVPIERGPLHWVMPHSPGETRAYLRAAVSRDELLQTEDPRVVALTQTTFQYREERRNRMKAGKVRLKGDGASAVIPSAGTRPTYEAIQNLMRQRRHFLEDEGVRMIFDLETASLFPEHGIRELSYRMVDKEGQLVAAPKTINLKNSIMGLGYYTEGMEEFIARGTKMPMPHDVAAEELTEFFEQAGQARYIIGQNAMFDVNMLEEVKKSQLFHEGHRLVTQHGADTAKLTGRDAKAVRLFRAANGFFEKAYSSDFVDTAAHARMLMSEVDQVRLSVADEIFKRGESKLFSIENLILQSSFIEDIVATGAATREEVAGRLTGQGLHSADVDTWFTDMLSRLQRTVYAGGRTPEGREVLRAEALGKSSLEMVLGRSVSDAEVTKIRKGISAGAAITPFTNLPVEMVQELKDKNLITQDELDAVERGTSKITGMQKMILMSRDVSLAPKVPGKFADVAASTGLFSRFLEERGILDDNGFLRGNALLPGVDEWQAFQDTLSKAGYAAPGQAFPERLMTHLFATAPGVEDKLVTRIGAQGQMAQMRRVIGETAGVGEWMPVEAPTTFPRKRAPRSIAIPLEDLRAMEEAGVIKGTNLKAAYAREGVQWMGISPFQYRTWWGKNVEDVALTVKGVIDKDATVAGEQIDRIVNWLRDTKGMGQADLDRIAQGLRATGATTGIQVATMAGARGSQAATRVFNLAKHLGYDVDRAGTGMMLPLLVGKEGGPVGPAVRTGAARERVLDHIYRPEEEASVLNDLAYQAEMTDVYEKEMMGSETLLDLDRKGLGYNYGMKQGAEETIQNKFWQVVTDLPDKYARMTTGKKMGAIGAIATIGLGAYYMRKRKESREAGEALTAMPYEYGGFYNTYRGDLGMAQLSSAEMAHNGARNRDPLATASLPAYLDGNKRRSYQMDTRSKNSHLFGGATGSQGYGG
jgi:hypothetical protein